jgi:cytochrome c oxidase assembly protein subunit 15
VTVHLVVALIIVSLLLYATLVAFFPESTPASARRRPAFTWTAILLVVTTLAQVTLGAQVRGRIDDALTAGTPRAEALATVGTYDLWHRELSLAVFGLAIVLLLLMWRRQERAHALIRATCALVTLVLLQLGLGVSLAYAGLTPAVQVAHLTGASLVLGAATVTVLLARWLP